MRIRRGLLFWGLVLVPLGAIPLLARAGIVDPNALADAWRLWPLALVAIGLALVLGRGQSGLLGVAIAGLVLGIAGGSALASGNAWFGTFSGCGDSGAPALADQRGDAFDGPAAVSLRVRCGSVDLTAGPVTGWSVDARYGSQPPAIDVAGSSLRVAAPDEGAIGRQEWSIQVPATSLRDVDLRANAAAANLRLGDASLDRLAATVNAADLLIDAGGGGIGTVDVSMNAGRVRLMLGRGPTTGAIDVNAGAVDLCVPPGAALRLTVNDQLTFAHNLRGRGLTQAGTTWTRSGSTDDTIDLRIQGNAASLALDPEGGCR